MHYDLIYTQEIVKVILMHVENTLTALTLR